MWYHKVLTYVDELIQSVLASYWVMASSRYNSPLSLAIAHDQSLPIEHAGYLLSCGIQVSSVACTGNKPPGKEQYAQAAVKPPLLLLSLPGNLATITNTSPGWSSGETESSWAGNPAPYMTEIAQQKSPDGKPMCKLRWDCRVKKSSVNPRTHQ